MEPVFGQNDQADPGSGQAACTNTNAFILGPRVGPARIDTPSTFYNAFVDVELLVIAAETPVRPVVSEWRAPPTATLSRPPVPSGQLRPE